MIYLGDWRTVLVDVTTVDAVITDPPYSARTHHGHDAGGPQIVSTTGQATRRAIGYEPWTVEAVGHFMDFWDARCTGWIAVMTDDVLAPVVRKAAEVIGRMTFAPVPILQKRPRFLGDGPASWTVWLCVSRPRSKDFLERWRAGRQSGCLPGAYFADTEKNSPIAGAKPLGLMRSIVRDYSNPGDVVCDPFAGGGTTLRAAFETGRRAIGAEIDPVTHAFATKRLAEPVTADAFETEKFQQGDIFKEQEE